MDPLKPSSTLAASLRALRTTRTGASSGQEKSGSRTAAAADGPGDLRERLLHLVSDIDPTDPDAVRRARRPVVTAILLNEFGDALRADPRFEEMVASVEAALQPRGDGTDPFVDLVAVMKKGQGTP